MSQFQQRKLYLVRDRKDNQLISSVRLISQASPFNKYLYSDSFLLPEYAVKLLIAYYVLGIVLSTRDANIHNQLEEHRNVKKYS